MVKPSSCTLGWPVAALLKGLTADISKQSFPKLAGYRALANMEQSTVRSVLSVLQRTAGQKLKKYHLSECSWYHGITHEGK